MVWMSDALWWQCLNASCHRGFKMTIQFVSQIYNVLLFNVDNNRMIFDDTFMMISTAKVNKTIP